MELGTNRCRYASAAPVSAISGGAAASSRRPLTSSFVPAGRNHPTLTLSPATQFCFSIQMLRSAFVYHHSGSGNGAPPSVSCGANILVGRVTSYRSAADLEASRAPGPAQPLIKTCIIPITHSTRPIEHGFGMLQPFTPIVTHSTPPPVVCSSFKGSSRPSSQHAIMRAQKNKKEKLKRGKIKAGQL
jgi:hypothetical protein